MKKKPLDIAGFLKLVMEALNAAGGEYLIGGVIGGWIWGEPRATQDLDLVVKIPIKSINKLSKELKKKKHAHSGGHHPGFDPGRSERASQSRS